MDVAPAINFDFSSSSYGSGHNTNMSSSPIQLPELYREFEDLLIADYANRNSSLAVVPFAWEEKPGVPKTENLVYEAPTCAGSGQCEASLLAVEFAVPFAWEEKPGVPKMVNLVHEAPACLESVGCEANLSHDEFAIPFAWEEKPGIPKTTNLAHEAPACLDSEACQANLFQDEFSFDVSCHLDRPTVPAEDLFHGGVIRTVDAPHRQEQKVERERGRDRGFSSSRVPSTRSRRTRSLPPLGTYTADHQRQQMAPPPRVFSSENGSRKWSFMDLFLFRSASDGRAMDTDPLKKYSANFRKHDQDIRNSGSMSKRRGRLSAHELHYNVNRAVSNDMKKKTYLPYKQGILGRFSFNP